MAVPQAVRSLSDVAGSRITRIRRVYYVYRGVPDTDFGPLELALGGRIVLLDNAADGETLRVRTQEWEDPFTEPLTGENRAFVEESGKWAAFDVSANGTFSNQAKSATSGARLCVTSSAT